MNPDKSYFSWIKRSMKCKSHRQRPFDKTKLSLVWEFSLSDPIFIILAKTDNWKKLPFAKGNFLPFGSPLDNIKKQVGSNQCKYVCIKLVRACWENWQYALTMQVSKGTCIVPFIWKNMFTKIKETALSWVGWPSLYRRKCILSRGTSFNHYLNSPKNI